VKKAGKRPSLAGERAAGRRGWGGSGGQRNEELNMKKEKTELPTYLPLGWAESPRVLILSCISFKEWMME
jgi:hypothetical protein